MYHSFLIHSSDDGHLGCFHDLAIINIAMNIWGTCVSFNSVNQIFKNITFQSLHTVKFTLPHVLVYFPVNFDKYTNIMRI